MAGFRRFVGAADISRLNAKYDKRGDVMYVAMGPSVPGFAESQPGGVILRFSESDETPCGVTVIGYEESGWPAREGVIAEKISEHLHVPRDEVRRVIAHARARGA